MAKKSVDAEHEAYKSRGMKAPRPEAYSPAKPSQSDAPKNKGPYQEKKDPHDVDMMKKPSEETPKMAPQHKGAAHKPAEAKLPFSGINGGEKMDVNEHYENPLHDMDKKK